MKSPIRCRFSQCRFVILTLMALLIVGCAMSLKTPATKNPMLDYKIGQMLMVGFRGLDVNDNSIIISDIKQRHLGGVILFDYDVPTQTSHRNISSPEQLKKLTAKLQLASPELLLIAIDQEGGKVARLKQSCGFASAPPAEKLGKTNDPQLTYRYADQIAETLANLGININLAPVVDLNINPDNPVIGKLGRSYSHDPDIVTEHTLQFIKAHHKQKILCALKHFPGHGSSCEDSHLGLTDITNTWTDIELEPFKNIIEKRKADIIMTAHVFNANIDAEFPATLSKITITELLREKLKYDGVVISDDMQMAAISEHYGFETALKLTINAGVDIILIANNSSYEPRNASLGHTQPFLQAVTSHPQA